MSWSMLQYYPSTIMEDMRITTERVGFEMCYRWTRRLGYTWAYTEMLRMLKLNYAVWKQ